MFGKVELAAACVRLHPIFPAQLHQYFSNSACICRAGSMSSVPGNAEEADRPRRTKRLRREREQLSPDDALEESTLSSRNRPRKYVGRDHAHTVPSLDNVEIIEDDDLCPICQLLLCDPYVFARASLEPATNLFRPSV